MGEADRSVCNGYVKKAECYGNALRNMPDELGEMKERFEKRYRQVESEKDNFDTETVNAPESEGEGNEEFYSVLYRLNLSTDIGSCKKAAVMLKSYLNDNPGSVMGETMLQIIGEQLED